MKGFAGIRKKLGLNQLEMALLLGCSRAYISLIELGRRKPDLITQEKLLRLSEAIKMPPPSKKVPVMLTMYPKEHYVKIRNSKAGSLRIATNKLNLLEPKIISLVGMINFLLDQCQDEADKEKLEGTQVYVKMMDRAAKLADQSLNLQLSVAQLTAQVDVLNSTIATFDKGTPVPYIEWNCFIMYI